MSRRAHGPAARLPAGPEVRHAMLAKFINMVMKSGKKSVAEKIVYNAIERISERVGKDQSRAIEMLSVALDNIKPAVEVKSRRVGGATYQVPVEVRASRRETLAMRWAIEAARAALGEEHGHAARARAHRRCRESRRRRQKREDTHRMADANKAFAHYRW